MSFWAQAQAQPQSHEHQSRPLSVEKVIVWCAFGRNGIIGRYCLRMLTDVQQL